jgi:hypothetical protein
MFLTGEGALLAFALAALVCGIVGAWALLRVGVRRPSEKAVRREVGRAGAVRRVMVSTETTPKV